MTNAAKALAAGGAANYWRRAIALRAAWLSDGRGATRWIGRLVAGPPTFRAGPLFGSQLADIVAALNRRKAGGERAQRGGRNTIETSAPGARAYASLDAASRITPARARTIPSYAMERILQEPGTEASANRSSASSNRADAHIARRAFALRLAPPDIPVLPRRATIALLDQSSGGVMPEPISVFAQRPARLFPSTSASTAVASLARPQNGNGRAPRLVPSYAASFAIRDRLVARVLRWASTAFRQTALLERSLAATLRRHWIEPIAGIVAPAELVDAAFVNRVIEEGGPVGDDRIGLSETANLESAGHPRSTIRGIGDVIEHAAAIIRVDGADHLRYRVVHATAQTFPAPVRVAPPAPTVPMRALVSPDAGGLDTHIAATFVAGATIREELAAEDDLEPLTAKLRQIFADEARRHGIEV